MKVPQGVSGRSATYTGQVDQETMANELVLLSLGSFEPLNIYVDTGKYMQEIAEFHDDWVDYLPRTDRPNNRRALTLTNLPGKTHQDVPSLAEASYAAGRRLSELEFNWPTDVYRACTSLHPFLNMWLPLGRTFIVQSNTGGACEEGWSEKRNHTLRREWKICSIIDAGSCLGESTADNNR